MELKIISPYTHLNGHYWSYTADLLHALSTKIPDVTVFASRKPRYSLGDSGLGTNWKTCCAWTRFILSDRHRARNWGGRFDSLIRNLEFYLCLKRTMRVTGVNKAPETHIHCIESRHRILVRAVLRSDISFSTLCVGEPSQPMNEDMAENYRRAFATGRLTFFVETEAVAKAWKELAGDHVIHIPAALPWITHQPMDQVQARKKLRLPESAFICLFFGTHREGKDYRLAIEAAKASNSGPFLLFVGPLISGNDPQTLLEQFDYRHAESRETYFPDEDVPALFDATDVVMLPYSNNYIKGSAVLLQACHFGKPVVATNTGHLKEFVSENQNGILFEVGSVESLAACYDGMAALKTSGRMAERFGFAEAASKYSWGRLVDRYLEVFFKTDSKPSRALL